MNSNNIPPHGNTSHIHMAHPNKNFQHFGMTPHPSPPQPHFLPNGGHYQLQPLHYPMMGRGGNMPQFFNQPPPAMSQQQYPSIQHSGHPHTPHFGPTASPFVPPPRFGSPHGLPLPPPNQPVNSMQAPHVAVAASMVPPVPGLAPPVQQQQPPPTMKQQDVLQTQPLPPPKESDPWLDDFIRIKIVEKKRRKLEKHEEDNTSVTAHFHAEFKQIEEGDEDDRAFEWKSLTVKKELREIKQMMDSIREIIQSCERELAEQDHQQSSSTESSAGSSNNNTNTNENRVIYDRLTKANQLRQKLIQRMQKFESSDFDAFKDKVLKRQRNKRWKERKKIKTKLTAAEELSKREKLHRQIDDWRALRNAHDLAAQKAIDAEKEAQRMDASLRLKQKQLESTRELIAKICQLREMRRDKLRKQGKLVPVSSNAELTLEQIRAKMESEAGQQRNATANATTTTTTTQEAADKASGTIAKPDISYYHDTTSRETIATATTTTTISATLQEDETSTPAPVRPIFEERERKRKEQEDARLVYERQQQRTREEIYEFYNRGNTDIRNLIEIRWAWDLYLAPNASTNGGSRVPSRLLEPPPPSNELWAAYLAPPMKTKKASKKRKRGHDKEGQQQDGDQQRQR